MGNFLVYENSEESTSGDPPVRSRPVESTLSTDVMKVGHGSVSEG